MPRPIKNVDFIFYKNNKIARIEVKLSDFISVKDMDNLLFLSVSLITKTKLKPDQ